MSRPIMHITLYDFCNHIVTVFPSIPEGTQIFFFLVFLFVFFFKSWYEFFRGCYYLSVTSDLLKGSKGGNRVFFFKNRECVSHS